MKRHRPAVRHSANRRRGAVMVAAAICLLLASLVLASALKLSLADRRQVRREQLRTQAEWLAEAGFERAAARLADDAGYQGETWNIAAADLGGRHAGQVVIEVDREDEEEERRVVTATARFPAGATPSAQRTRRAIVRTSNE